MPIVLDGSNGITAPGGTAAAPSITTVGDTNTGIFFPAADTIAFSEGGVEAARFNSIGDFLVGGTAVLSPAINSTEISINNPRTSSSGGSVIAFGIQGSRAGYVYADVSSNIEVNSSTGYVQLSTVGGLARFTSGGNFGIGTGSPATKLDVNGDVTQRNGSGTIIGNIQNSSGWYDFKGSANVNGAQISTAAATPIRFLPNGVEAGRFDSSGNLGLGVTPSAWASNYKAMQLGSVSSIADTGTATRVTSNGWVNSAGDNKYLTTAAATTYIQSGGQHLWYNAPSGTAGNTISFTQAMTLDASGNLGVGITNPTDRLSVFIASGDSQAAFGNSTRTNYVGTQGTSYGALSTGDLKLYTTGAAVLMADNAAGIIKFAAGGSAERARITSGGDLLVGTTSAGFTGRFVTLQTTSASNVMTAWNSATSGDNSLIGFFTDGGTGRGSITYNRAGGLVAYNTTSDYRLKDNIANAADSGDKVDAIKVRQFDWKETGNHVDYGFVAQELHDVAPHAVTKPDDEDKMWSVDYSKLVPMLVKEIQSLRARLAALEGNN